MDTTLYVSLSHQTVMKRQMDVIANNLANMNTTGFKRENVMFHEYINENKGDNIPRSIQRTAYVQDYGISRQMTDGDIIVSGNDFDVALSGNGLFEVEKDDGTLAYTRNGSFSLSSEGTLVTSTGHEVMGDGGAIQIPLEAGQITIASDGTVSTKETGVIGKIKVVTFSNFSALKKVGDNLYQSTEKPQDADDFTIVQGATEGSNVIAISEVTTMITLSRAYMNTAKMINQLEELETKAINRLAKVA